MEIALQRPAVEPRRPRARGTGISVTAIEPARLYREHGESLLRYLIRMCGDTDLAADVVQDTFLRLVERPPRSHEHVRAWLFQVATNRLRDLRRKETRRDGLLHEGVGRGALADPPRTPDRDLEQSEARRTVRAALGSLSDRDRQILLMREEGFAHREIAEAVGTTTGSVGTLIARALDKLSRVLEGDPDATTPPGRRDR